MSRVLFFFYANIFPSHFVPLSDSRGTLFVQRFWSPAKSCSHVLSGLKTWGVDSQGPLHGLQFDKVWKGKLSTWKVIIYQKLIKLKTRKNNCWLYINTKTPIHGKLIFFLTAQDWICCLFYHRLIYGVAFHRPSIKKLVQLVLGQYCWNLEY